MADSILSAAEKLFLAELETKRIPYMIVGMSAALLQGARGATEDIDLWFEDLTDPRIGQAVRAAGGIWISGAFGAGPPQIGGDALGERFDVVTHMSGLGTFQAERHYLRYALVEGFSLPLLALERILVSKKAANRTKDQALIHSLETCLLALKKK